MRRLFLFLALAVGISACQISTKPLPFQVSMTLSKTAGAPGDTIGVMVTAQGGRILNIQCDFADGDPLAFPTGGARTAQALFPHVYNTAGNYTVTVTVTDGNEGDKVLTNVVHIQ